MYELARMVQFLHTSGADCFCIFHHDIKSGNICLTQGEYMVKLINCGLAKFVWTRVIHLQSR
jgi:serine/threonine protein kinase